MKHKRLLSVIALVLLAFGGLLVHRSSGWAQFSGLIGQTSVDLARPDALIRTKSLSQLPRDLLKVPLAKDLLSEEFVFYYAEHPDRLGLQGTLRRIAYEHDLKLQDQILAWLFDQPAEIALWRDGKGRLRYWLMAMARKELARCLHEAATLAAKDRQLTLAGEIKVDDKAVQLLALEYAPQRTALIAAYADRVVILSDPAMLLHPDRSLDAGAESVVRRLLSTDAPSQAVYRDAFQLDAPPKHSVLVRAHYLSFGYQRFFPGLEALRFDFGDKGWATYALLDAPKLPVNGLKDAGLWLALPANPAACSLLPVDWQAAAALERAPQGEGNQVRLAAELDGPAAVCWYADARMDAPLFVAALKAPRDDLAGAFQSLFDWGIAKPAPEAVTQTIRRGPDEVLWQPGHKASSDDADEPVAEQEAGEAADQEGPVTLARKGRYILFSPDGKQVERAIAALSKRYPALAETLPGKGTTLAVVAPRALAELTREEVLAVLDGGREPVFREVAEARLLPRLEAVSKYPAYRLALAAPPAARGWQPVEWQPLRK